MNIFEFAIEAILMFGFGGILLFQVFSVVIHVVQRKW